MGWAVVADCSWSFVSRQTPLSLIKALPSSARPLTSLAGVRCDSVLGGNGDGRADAKEQSEFAVWKVSQVSVPVVLASSGNPDVSVWTSFVVVVFFKLSVNDCFFIWRRSSSSWLFCVNNNRFSVSSRFSLLSISSIFRWHCSSMLSLAISSVSYFSISSRCEI